MKKVKFSGKLSLNKETVVKLNVEQMDVIKGGSDGAAEIRLSIFKCCHTCSSQSLAYCTAK